MFENGLLLENTFDHCHTMMYIWNRIIKLNITPMTYIEHIYYSWLVDTE